MSSVSDDDSVAPLAGDAAPLALGCCHCTDCGGSDASAECFWDTKRQVTGAAGGTESETDANQSGGDGSADPLTDGESTGSKAESRPRKSVGQRLRQTFSRPKHGSSDSTSQVLGDAAAATALGPEAASTPPPSTTPVPPPAKDSKKSKKKRAETEAQDLATRLAAMELELARARSDLQLANRSVEAMRNQSGVCEGRIDELTRNNARLASDLHAERQLHAQTKRKLLHPLRAGRISESSVSIDAGLGPSLSGSLTSVVNPAVPAIQAHFQAALGGISVGPFLPRTVTWTPGNEHPYTFHLQRVAEHCLPHIVGVLVGLCPKPGAVLVGPAAWNAYVDMPLPLADGLDFVVAVGPAAAASLRAEALPELLHTSVRIAATVPDVQHALCVLEAVAAAVGKEDGVPPRTDRSVPLPARVLHAEQAMPVPGRDYAASQFVVVASDYGARLKLGTLTLLSLSLLPPARHALVTDSPEHFEPLSNVSVTWRVQPPPVGPNPPIRIAPVPMLLAFMQESLLAQQTWRVTKNLPRLRSIYTSAWLQLQSRRGPLIPYYLFLEGLLQHHDPLCFEVFTFTKRLTVEALASAPAAPDSASLVSMPDSHLSTSRLSVASFDTEDDRRSVSSLPV